MTSLPLSRFVLHACLVGSMICAASTGRAVDPAVQAKATAIAQTALLLAPRPNNEHFQATAEEMDQAMHADSATAQKTPLQFPKGNGLRVLMTGHSYVAPATRTLPALMAAAGYDGFHERFHTSGGSTGSANAIWLTEFGKFKNKPAAPILLPAIATGQWDVMTWGAYFNDTADCYTPWIDVCLAKNPNMIFFIQDGWPSYPRMVSADDHDLILAALDTELRLGLEKLFRPLYDSLDKLHPGKVHVIPVAPAVVEMIHHYYAGELPGLDCISEDLGGKRGIYRDGGHLSSNSGLDQLVGYCYFGMLERQSPERITAYKPAHVDPTVDRLMRQAAWHSITQSPLSGITDKAGKGVAD